MIEKSLSEESAATISVRNFSLNRFVVVEINLGQYVREIERKLKDKVVEFFGRMDGRLLKPAQIKERVDD